MNIAIITAELPYPCNSGGRIYTWERAKILKEKGHKIYLYTFSENNEFINNEKLLSIFEEVKIYERNYNKIDIIKNIMKPFSAYTRYNKDLKIDLIKKNDDKLIDIIIMDMPQLYYNISEEIKLPIICSQHNIEYKTFINIAKYNKNLFKKVAFLFEGIKLKYFENKIYKRDLIKGYTFISDQDMKYFEMKYSNKKTCLISMGYENYYSKKEIKQNNIVFTGKMNYQPNVEAMIWFVNNIFPLIRNHIKDIELFIVGKDPVEEIVKLNEIEGVIITGLVENVNEYIDKASIVVIPLLSGGGVKIKLLEALGRGKIVVTTSKGVEGTEFLDKEHLLIANDKEEFAKKCIDTIKSLENYHKLPIKAQELINKEYSWNKIGSIYDEFLCDIKSKGV